MKNGKVKKVVKKYIFENFFCENDNDNADCTIEMHFIIPEENALQHQFCFHVFFIQKFRNTFHLKK